MQIEGQRPVVISFMSPVDNITGPALCSAFANVVNSGHDEIHLMLSTPGGSVADGIAAYNLMMSLPVRIKTYNLGTVDSIGNVLFMGGSRRLALPVSRFMFHGVGFDIQAARMEMKDLKERASAIGNDQSMIADILVKHTNLATDDVQKLFLEAAFLRSMEAEERGIVHEVREISIPAGLPIIQLVFQR